MTYYNNHSFYASAEESCSIHGPYLDLYNCPTCDYIHTLREDRRMRAEASLTIINISNRTRLPIHQVSEPNDVFTMPYEELGMPEYISTGEVQARAMYADMESRSRDALFSVQRRQQEREAERRRAEAERRRAEAYYAQQAVEEERARREHIRREAEDAAARILARDAAAMRDPSYYLQHHGPANRHHGSRSHCSSSGSGSRSSCRHRR